MPYTESLIKYHADPKLFNISREKGEKYLQMRVDREKVRTLRFQPYKLGSWYYFCHYNQFSPTLFTVASFDYECFAWDPYISDVKIHEHLVSCIEWLIPKSFCLFLHDWYSTWDTVWKKATTSGDGGSYEHSISVASPIYSQGRK